VPYSATYLPETGVVSIVYDGDVTPADGAEAIGATGMLVERHRCDRLLADCSSAEFDVTLFDVLTFVEAILSAPGPKVREAVVLPLDETAAGRVQFFETACRNRGLNVRLFPDRDVALAWLTG
jgi:hypothetical protein